MPVLEQATLFPLPEAREFPKALISVWLLMAFTLKLVAKPLLDGRKLPHADAPQKALHAVSVRLVWLKALGEKPHCEINPS